MEEMRRKDQEVTELEAVKEIIRQCDVLRLGLADGDYPYIVPMNFGWEEKEGRLYFYLHGAAEGRKAELLRQNGACSFQMDCGHRVVQLPGHGITTRYGCVMGKATVTPLTEEEKPQAMRLLIDRYLPGAPGCPPQAMARTAMWRLEVADWSAKENKD